MPPRELPCCVAKASKPPCDLVSVFEDGCLFSQALPQFFLLQFCVLILVTTTCLAQGLVAA
jgi:hypothetical protein